VQAEDTDIPVQSNGPCGFNIQSHADACAAFSPGDSLRKRLANVLHRLADKAEGVQSLVIVGYGPPQITFNDVVDASAIGFTGASKYLNDLWRDRVFGSTDGRQTEVTHPPSPCTDANGPRLHQSAGLDPRRRAAFMLRS
jgi:hypothetical protein